MYELDVYIVACIGEVSDVVEDIFGFPMDDAFHIRASWKIEKNIKKVFHRKQKGPGSCTFAF